MKTMSYPATRTPQPIESSTRLASSDSAESHGRSSQATQMTWIIVALVSTAAVLVATPTLAGWLLLPAIPAILLRWACRDSGSRCDRAVMRIFSIATFVAIITQLVVMVPALFPAIVVATAVVLFLFSIEQLAVARPQ